MVKLNRKHMRDCGFTLLETAISLLILSLLMGALLTQYQNYQENKRNKKTEELMISIVQSIENYKENFGHYPCPASLSASRDASPSNYGRAGNCSDTSVSFGACAASGDYCIQRSPNTTLNLAERRVRIGAVPFRELALSETETYDGFGSRFVYVVTEHLTNAATYNDNKGGIRVLDDNGVSLSFPDNSIKMALLSMGKNKVGARTIHGNITQDCSLSYIGRDRENCDFLSGAVDASFLFTSKSEAETSDRQDDNIIFSLPKTGTGAGGWRIGSLAGENPNDIILMDRKVRVGNSTAIATNELTINGSLLVSNGSIKAKDFCDQNGSNCFKVADLIRNCGVGEYVTGIVKGADASLPTTKILCSPVYYGCDVGQVLAGKNADGSPRCVIPPPTIIIDKDGDGKDDEGDGSGNGNGNGDGNGDGDNCTTASKTETLTCPMMSGKQYKKYQTYDCKTKKWISGGDTSGVDCCNIPNTQTGTESCGPFALSGSVTFTRTKIPGTCSYGPKVYSGGSSCTCRGNETVTLSYSKGCSSNETNNICAKQTYEYKKDSSGMCTIRNEVNPSSPGSCKPARFIVQATGSPDETKPNSYTPEEVIKKEGSECSGKVRKCQKQIGFGWGLYSGCNCVKQNEACTP